MGHEYEELLGIFDEVKDKESLFIGLPDGEYLAKVVDMELGESKNRELPMVTISFEIIEGEEKGRIHKQFLMLAGKNDSQLRQNVHRYATSIKKFGIDTSKKIIDTFKEFNKAIDKEVKLKLETTVAKKTGNKYQNTSFEVLE